MILTKKPAIISLGIILGLILFSLAALKQSQFKPEDFGLGLNTIGLESTNEHIRSYGSTPQIVSSFKALRNLNRNIALWLGASQLHAINEMKKGDRLAVQYANEMAADRRAGLYYLQRSEPNANLHELLAMYLEIRSEEYVPDWILLAVTYDDLSEEAIRESFLKSLNGRIDNFLQSGGTGVLNLQEAIKELGETEAQGAIDRNPTAGTPQEALEGKLVGLLNEALPGFKHRGQLNSQIKVSIRSAVRSFAAGRLKQKKVRDVPDYLKEWNTQALVSFIQLAQEDNVKMLVYKPPHRPSSGPFYHNREAYDQYFEELAKICEGFDNVHYLDLEGIVPQEYWGLTQSGRPDVFHFKDYGHQLLGKHIDRHLSKLNKEQRYAVQ